MTDDTDLYDALRQLEQTEDDLAAAVRGAEADAEGSSETPVIKADEIDDLRDHLTQARANLVDALLARELNTGPTTMPDPSDLRLASEDTYPLDEVGGLRERRGDK